MRHWTAPRSGIGPLIACHCPTRTNLTVCPGSQFLRVSNKADPRSIERNFPHKLNSRTHSCALTTGRREWLGSMTSTLVAIGPSKGHSRRCMFQLRKLLQLHPNLPSLNFTMRTPKLRSTLWSSLSFKSERDLHFSLRRRFVYS